MFGVDAASTEPRKDVVSFFIFPLNSAVLGGVCSFVVKSSLPLEHETHVSYIDICVHSCLYSKHIPMS